MTDERWAAKVGTELRRYRIDALIGVGGMGAVFAATHQNRRRFALKFLAPEYAGRADLRARFVREALVANTIAHPGVVSITDDEVTDEGQPVLVMELLDGGSLDAIQSRGGNLSARDAVEIARQVLDVLAAAHSKGVVHRDIKPQNVFLTRKGKVKLLDFGIARLHDAESTLSTQYGESFGTPGFKPREQELGLVAEIDGRTDLWALGATVFFLVTGAYVHEAETVQERSIFASTRPARSLREAAPGAPDGLVAIVDRALAFRREDRWSSAREMAAALEALAKSGALGGPPDLVALAKKAPRGAWHDPGFEPTKLTPDAADGEAERQLLSQIGERDRRRAWTVRGFAGVGLVVAASVGGYLLWGAWTQHTRDVARATMWSRALKCLGGSASPSESTLELELATAEATLADYPSRCTPYVEALATRTNDEDAGDEADPVRDAASDVRYALGHPRRLAAAIASLGAEGQKEGFRYDDPSDVAPPPTPLTAEPADGVLAKDEDGGAPGVWGQWTELTGQDVPTLLYGQQLCRLDGKTLRCRDVALPSPSASIVGTSRDGDAYVLDAGEEKVVVSTVRPDGSKSESTFFVPKWDGDTAHLAFVEGWLAWLDADGKAFARGGRDPRSPPQVLATGSDAASGLAVVTCEGHGPVLAACGGSCEVPVARLQVEGDQWRVADACPPPLRVTFSTSHGYTIVRTVGTDGVEHRTLVGPHEANWEHTVVAARSSFVVASFAMNDVTHLVSIRANGEVEPITVAR